MQPLSKLQVLRCFQGLLHLPHIHLTYCAPYSYLLVPYSFALDMHKTWQSIS